MKIIRQSWEFMSMPDGDQILKLIESAGRVCYKTEGKMGDGTAPEFIRKRIDTGHESVIEHASVSVRIITDRGVTHEIVRHRLASYSQESTRYCNYGVGDRGITVILPIWMYQCEIEEGEYWLTEDKRLATIMSQNGTGYRYWVMAMFQAEQLYNTLLQHDWSPQEARSVLPNSLKTELVMTANIREWRHFFSLRCSEAAHPQMQALARSMLKGFKDAVPVLFDDMRTRGGDPYALGH